MTEKTFQRYPLTAPARYLPDAEHELVVLLSRAELNGEQADIVRGLSASEIDWDHFLALSAYYMTDPLLYRHLQTPDMPVPHEVIGVLRDRTAAVFARTLRALEEAGRLRDLLQRKGIEALFTKGLPLVMDVYKDKGTRYFSDIDMLIRPEDAGPLERIFNEEGIMSFEYGRWDKYRTQRVYNLGGWLDLDVHTGLFGRIQRDETLGISVNDIFSRKRLISGDGLDIWTLSLEDTLVYQACHLAVQHAFSGIRWFLDINEFVREHKDSLDWKAFAGRVEAHRVKRPVYTALDLAARAYDMEFPEEIRANINKYGVDEKNNRVMLERVRSANREIEYLAELMLFDSYSDLFSFGAHSLAGTPKLIPHFCKVAFKAISHKL